MNHLVIIYLSIDTRRLICSACERDAGADPKEVRMRFDIRGQHIEVTEGLRAHATRRLQFALGRFGPRIARVTVCLTDLNGPHGGRDKQCRMVAEMPPGGKVIVEDIDADLYAAITQTADRLGRAVAREMERRREHSLYMPVASRRPAARVFRRQARTRNAPE
jgi:putative sigma-54 modulation protein